MNVYSIDVKVYATAYIKADSEAEALEIARGLTGEALYVATGEEAGFCDEPVVISGLRLDDPDLPDVSLSPAMTIHGPTEGVFPELQEEGVQ